jgi:serine/threonine protein kinase/alpha-tubulin suppressor-like RCC1 family protein
MAEDEVEIPLTEPPRPDEPAPLNLWPAELDADYTLMGELGRGGMAVVFRARDRDLGREVAVKVVRPRFAADEEAVARLAREARTVAQLEHPNIVGVYSIRHLADRSVALVMQLIPGRTLKQAVTEDGPFDAASAEQVLRDIARALAYAHRAGVVHRDVKPENIFLDASSGRAMLSDFGVARVMDAPTELTATGTTIGTPTYMAPEQIDGVNLDGRSDLYSLGMVGWEMLTGERPWAGESLYSVIYRQKHDQLTPIDSYRDDIPPRTQYLIEGLMPKNPDRRWASAARFLTLLASDQPLPGFKEWESAQRRRRRSRVFQQARQRGDSMIEAALETVKFSRPPTPVAPLAPKIPTPAESSDTIEQFFEPTGDAAPVPRGVRTANRRTPALAAATGAGAVADIPSGGFSVQRPPQLAHTRLTPGSTVAPARRGRKFVFAGLVVMGLAAAAALAWIQFGPAGAAEVQTANIPEVKPDDRAITVPVLPAVDSATLRATDSVLAESARKDSIAAAIAANTPAPGVTGAPRVPNADSARLAPNRGSAVTRGSSSAPVALPSDSAPRPAVTPVPVTPSGPSLNFPRDPGIIGGGLGHSCTLFDGRVACWGNNDNGQLGDGASESRATPAFVAGDFSFQQITAGFYHSCAVTTVGEVYCWGKNESGQLGDGTTQSRNAPVRIGSSTSYRLVLGGREHTCGLTTSRSVQCWGLNADGQLGDGSRNRRTSPGTVDLPAPVHNLAVGWNHSCAITADGSAWCWGKNDNGQLGDGTTTSRTTPIRVKFIEPLVSIAAGSAHTCAVTESGAAWCWGANSNGQLGSGTTVASSIPTPVSASTSFSTIVAGGLFSCARGKDSSAWCWGQNNNGQLGDGTTTNRNAPVAVRSLSRVRSLQSGGGHTCAVNDRNETYCWGRNIDGQLGRVGDREASLVPLRVLTPNR